MLEIIALYFLCKRMGEKLRSKGWKKPLFMQIFVVLSWFGCMFIGSVAYGVFRVIRYGPEAAKNLGFGVYPIALLTATAGVGVLFLVAAQLPDRSAPPLLAENLPH